MDYILDKLRLIITGIVGLLIVGAVASFFTERNMSIITRIEMIVCVIVLGLIMYIIVYYWWGKDHKCPSCKKNFCLKKEGTSIVSKEAVSVLVETNTKNRNGDVIGTQEQYVPGERVTYRIDYICKKCGERCHSTYTKDNAKV